MFDFLVDMINEVDNAHPDNIADSLAYIPRDICFYGWLFTVDNLFDGLIPLNALTYAVGVTDTSSVDSFVARLIMLGYWKRVKLEKSDEKFYKFVSTSNDNGSSPLDEATRFYNDPAYYYGYHRPIGFGYSNSNPFSSEVTGKQLIHMLNRNFTDTGHNGNVAKNIADILKNMFSSIKISKDETEIGQAGDLYYCLVTLPGDFQLAITVLPYKATIPGEILKAKLANWLIKPLSRQIDHTIFVYPSTDEDGIEFLSSNPNFLGITDQSLLRLLNAIAEYAVQRGNGDEVAGALLAIFDSSLLHTFDAPPIYCLNLLKKNLGNI